MVHPSLFLYLFCRLVFPCSYLIGGTIPTSLLVLLKKIFTPLIYLHGKKCWYPVTVVKTIYNIKDVEREQSKEPEGSEVQILVPPSTHAHYCKCIQSCLILPFGSPEAQNESSEKQPHSCLKSVPTNNAMTLVAI